MTNGIETNGQSKELEIEHAADAPVVRFAILHGEAFSLIQYLVNERGKPDDARASMSDMVFAACRRAYGATTQQDLYSKVKAGPGEIVWNVSPELKRALVFFAKEANSERGIDNNGLAILNGDQRRILREMMARMEVATGPS